MTEIEKRRIYNRINILMKKYPLEKRPRSIDKLIGSLGKSLGQRAYFQMQEGDRIKAQGEKIKAQFLATSEGKRAIRLKKKYAAYGKAGKPIQSLAKEWNKRKTKAKVIDWEQKVRDREQKAIDRRIKDFKKQPQTGKVKQKSEEAGRKPKTLTDLAGEAWQRFYYGTKPLGKATQKRVYGYEWEN